ncbi:DJ-1/PfpI family protein [Mesorhizobium sp. NPDC059054]|uniref:DJ-1/PfpI family protein n=1 Tax=Mesorhizobium sp. NPDC059054 TaxID=3346711 RepID=UPI003689134D
MPQSKKIGFVFINRFADWEYGLLAASAVEWFGAEAISLTPEGQPVTSTSGFQLTPQRSIDSTENADLDAVAVIGSDVWASDGAPDVSGLVNAVAARGGVVGGICAGTLALARAGLFKDKAHTSNGQDWILKHLPTYVGAEHYNDVPHAVADGAIVSAPGSAPGTFAKEFIGALYPDKQSELTEMRALFAREYGASS